MTFGGKIGQEVAQIVKVVLADLGEIGEKAIEFLENPNTEAEIGTLISDAGAALGAVEAVQASGVTGFTPTVLALLKYVMNQPASGVKSSGGTEENPDAPDVDTPAN